MDAWQLENWEAYRDVARLGRKTRLPEARRAVLWSIFERVRAGLKAKGLITPAGLFTTLATAFSHAQNLPFDFAVVDEAQDIGVPHLRFFAALGGNRPNALFFAGDLGQRIFQQPFSWKALGVDIRGRSRTLRVNYRTSHQIRMQADRLLGPEMTDVDGNREDRSDTVSVFNGPLPKIQILKSETEETQTVGNWLSELAQAGVLPHECAIFVRSAAQLDRAKAAAEESGLAFKILDEHVETVSGHVSISTMHLAKGLEFRAVAVMACDDEIIPLQERIETVGDDADLEEVYNTERHLLYVACTRARDNLLVTGVEPASEFLDDLRTGAGGIARSAPARERQVANRPVATVDATPAKSDKADSSGSPATTGPKTADPTRALSIRQPHAEAIMRGVKTIEYRGTRTRVRGRIHIYASLGRYAPDEEEDMLAEYGIEDVTSGELPRGVIIGTVELYDCTEGDGPYEWHVRNPERATALRQPTKHPQPIWFTPF